VYTVTNIYKKYPLKESEVCASDFFLAINKKKDLLTYLLAAYS